MDTYIQQKRIIVIAEKRDITDSINANSVELDFSSRKTTDYIISTLKKSGFIVIHYETPKQFLDHIHNHKQDIVFSTLWGGKHSRNKRSYIAAICEAYGICYIGGDAFVQTLCQDKYLTKLYLEKFDFKLPKGVLIHNIDDFNFFKNKIIFPSIIKPNDEGCSVGIDDGSVVNDIVAAEFKVKQLLKYYSPIIIEEFIAGDEISICIVGNQSKIDIIEAVQLVIGDNNKVWEYYSKRINSGNINRKIVTPKLPSNILSTALELFKDLGKVDLIRVDGKLLDNQFYIIELSPDCSLSDGCFISEAFKHNDYSYAEMLEKLIENAYTDF